MKSKVLISICMALVILFSYTAVSKLIDIPLFNYEMHNQPLPHWMRTGLVFFLPAIELLIVVSLLIDKTRVVGLFASLVIMLSFTAYTALILTGAFHRVPCSCGGVIKNLTWKQHLFFNLFFVGLIIWGMFLQAHVKNKKIIHA